MASLVSSFPLCRGSVLSVGSLCISGGEQHQRSGKGIAFGLLCETPANHQEGGRAICGGSDRCGTVGSSLPVIFEHSRRPTTRCSRSQQNDDASHRKGWKMSIYPYLNIGNVTRPKSPLRDHRAPLLRSSQSAHDSQMDPANCVASYPDPT